MGSLVLDKINFAEAKKLQIAQELGLTGNPTWNQILSALGTLKSSIDNVEETDESNRKAIADKVNINWVIFGLPPDTSSVYTDRFCYVGNKAFYIGLSKYYEYNGGFSQKNWNSNAPAKNIGARGVWEDNGVLHFGKTSVYNPTTDNWDAVSDITCPFSLTNVFPKNFWKDYDGITHCDFETYHYVYNRSIKTWEAVTWNITIEYGDRIWTDGTTIYYNDTHYLDRETNTWLEKTWDENNELADMNSHGDYVFYIYDTNDNKIPYFSNGTENYKFDTTLGYWKKIKFNIPIENFVVQGNHIYYDKGQKGTTLYYAIDGDYRAISIYKPNYSSWTAVNNSLDNALDYLMEN